jgi:glycogen synthase
MNVLLLTNEYPPHIYGGAGVHIEHLSREMARCDDGDHRLQILCFGDQSETGLNKTVTGVGASGIPTAGHGKNRKLLDALARNIDMAGLAETADIVHCHTWYTHLAGCLIKQLLQIPLVVTTHSLEPHRPWKMEQLGNGYYAAAWLEKTALLNADRIIAVSAAMRDDALRLFELPAEKVRVIHNGIDLDTFRPTRNAAVLNEFGIDPRTPYLLFVGRITRQKGIGHLLNALHHVKTHFQIVLCAGAPDTDEIAAETKAAVAALRAQTENKVVWIREMVPVDRLVPIYSHAAAFVCPSVYEPFGIINLEAMACGTPVVASAVGGIPEVVVHGKTGLLVPFEPSGPTDAEPGHPERFARDLAAAIDALMQSPQKRAAMGAAARRHVEARFSWQRIAAQTLDSYAELIAPDIS